MSRKQQRQAVLVMLALAGIAAVELQYGPILVPVSADGSNPAKQSMALPKSQTALAEPSIGSFSEIAARPLFSATRRPPPPAPVHAKVASVKQEDFDLVGVIISNDGKMALLRPRNAGKVVLALEGKSFGGWQISSIAPAQVVLKRGDERSVLKLGHKNTVAAASNMANGGAAQDSGAASPFKNAGYKRYKPSDFTGIP